MYPGKDSCYKCICAKGFDASVPVHKNKHCQKFDCGHELRHLGDFKIGCVPLFYGKDRCCSIEYKCRKYLNIHFVTWIYCNTDVRLIRSNCFPAEKSDTVDATSTRTVESTDAQCKYGDLSLHVGQVVKQNNKCVTCKCEIPPMVSCYKEPDCQ